MSRSHKPARPLALAVFALCAAGAFAQSMDFLSLRVMPGGELPLGASSDVFKPGGGADVALDFDILPFASPSVELGYAVHPTFAENSLTRTSFGVGAVTSFFPATRLGFQLGALAGVYQAAYDDAAMGNFYGKGRFSVLFRLSPAFGLAASASYGRYLDKGGTLYEGLGLGLVGSLSIAGARGGTNVAVRDVAFDPIFPIFYSHYDKSPIGRVRVENRESGSIRDVRVSLFIKQFMDQPKLCAVIPVMKRNESVEVPIYALFTDQVLKLTESARSSAEIIIEYSYLDSPRRAGVGETVRINHRNALTWDDDRKAAAFVSAKDPAVLRYSKYAAGLIRESSKIDMNQNLRFTMGLFEALRLYGMNYVVDPTTPYKELSQSADALDFLQFPNQTLIYKGGDCDDLSILFCSILESVGIKTAFITVPGHIYMAFSLDMDEKEAATVFTNMGDLIVRDGTVWMPLEITLVNDGFLKAWQIGAKQWIDNSARESVAFLPIHDAWKDYEPVGIPGEDTRIVLPAPEQVVGAYNEALAKFINREIQPKADRLRSEILTSGNQPRHVNRLGVLYARFGMLDEAKAEFEKAGRQGYGPALTNLGNIAYLQKKYTDAVAYYQRALGSAGNNGAALIGIARAQYEMENYNEASVAYTRVRQVDPALADQYPYLVSRTEGAARAASAADRTAKTSWLDE